MLNPDFRWWRQLTFFPDERVNFMFQMPRRIPVESLFRHQILQAEPRLRPPAQIIMNVIQPDILEPRPIFQSPNSVNDFYRRPVKFQVSSFRFSLRWPVRPVLPVRMRRHHAKMLPQIAETRWHPIVATNPNGLTRNQRRTARRIFIIFDRLDFDAGIPSIFAASGICNGWGFMTAIGVVVKRMKNFGRTHPTRQKKHDGRRHRLEQRLKISLRCC